MTDKIRQEFGLPVSSLIQHNKNINDSNDINDDDNSNNNTSATSDNGKYSLRGILDDES